MITKEKIILDLCGGTGAWSAPYMEAGYDVRIVTLPHYPLFDDQIGDVTRYKPPDNVYGILAAPPCEQFSFVRQNAKTPRDFFKALEIVNACLKIVWQCRLKAKLAFWALENPKSYLRQFLGKAPFEFEHWEFGDRGYKPTEIWGYFNCPKKRVIVKPATRLMKTVQARNGLNRKAIRAMTPPGFAQAFFKANQ